MARVLSKVIVSTKTVTKRTKQNSTSFKRRCSIRLIPGRKKAGRWNRQSTLRPMCDVEKDWHERSFRASGAINGCQKSPLNKPEMSFSFFIFKPPVASVFLNASLIFSSQNSILFCLLEHHLCIFVVSYSNIFECRNVPFFMTKLCSAASFKSTPHYSSLNFTYVEDR